MMFRRRTPLPLAKKVRFWLWPTRGWGRVSRYLLHRMGRLPGSEYSIAGGFACGAAMSFTPLVGLHFVLSAVLAWIIRANPIAALIGTVIGNPWTFPFIWVWLYEAGQWMTSGRAAAAGAADAMNFSALFADSLAAALRGDIAFLAGTALPQISPMLLASLPTAAVAWLATYVAIRPVVRRYRLARVRRRRGRPPQDLEFGRGADAAATPPLRPSEENAS